MINLAVIASLIYGSLAIFGGLLGYIKVKSLPSLISGTFSGILLVIAAILQFQGIFWGKYLAIAVTLLLIVVFIIRWYKTKKVMPAGMMVIVGTACLVMISK